MRLLLFLTLAVVVTAIEVDAADEDLPELRIGVKHRPEACERKSKSGDELSIHYTGSLTDGTVFDSSLTRGQPFKFRLGAGMVIKGWDQGLSGMCVGEKRRLRIPPHLGYGDRGAGGTIPGGATLIFETELLGISD